MMPAKKGCRCSEALKNAIMTKPELIPDKTKGLELIIGKYISA